MMLVRLRASTGRRNSRMEISASGILLRLPTRLYAVADVVLRNLPARKRQSTERKHPPRGLHKQREHRGYCARAR